MTHQSTPALALLVRMGEGTPPPPATMMSTKWFAECTKQHGLSLLYTSPLAAFESQNGLRMTGYIPDLDTNTWQPSTLHPIKAIYNRCPTSLAPKKLKELQSIARQHQLPFGNTLEVRTLAQDKWRTQQLLEGADIQMPKTSNKWKDWRGLLSETGAFFLKPQDGAFGEGIYKIESIDTHYILRRPPAAPVKMEAQALETWLEAQAAQHPIILQTSVPSPFHDMQGLSIRALTQQTPSGSWSHAPPVARVSKDDPIANVARGANAIPLEDLLQERWGVHTSRQLIATIQAQNERICEAMLKTLTSPRYGLIELGLDYVLDEHKRLWLIEVNGFPQGRLIQLAKTHPDRFATHCQQLHHQPLSSLLACAL
ncbi:MAG: hypothetical protein CL920_28340 [Deltaproteobacteria bacterium]|nr:hypothetical protein [Deltaproteobacteria bacterium]MBU52624.1 hypothetical protein [Deltaproteobacteria bacterium]